jgi:hypothetical protein
MLVDANCNDDDKRNTINDGSYDSNTCSDRCDTIVPPDFSKGECFPESNILKKNKDYFK